MRRRLSVLAIVLVIALVVGACGGDDDDAHRLGKRFGGPRRGSSHRGAV